MKARVVRIRKNPLGRIRGNCELLFTIALFGTYIIFIFNSTVRFFVPQMHKIDTLFIYTLFILMILFTIREVLKRIKYWQMLSCVGILFLLLGSMIFSSNMGTNLAVVKSVVLECFPLFFLACTVQDFSAVKRYMDTAAIITVFCLGFVIYILGVGKLEEGVGYSQYMSYYVLLPTIILAGLLFEKFRIIILVSFFLGLFIMLSFGARGPLTCLAFFIALKLLTAFAKMEIHKKLALAFITSICGVLLYTLFYKLINWLIDVFQSFGFSIRAVQGLVDSSFLTDLSRSQIYTYCLNRISRNPFVGTGLVNDRIYITNAIFSGDSPIGNYPHNIFLEIWMQFGIFIGTIILTIITFMLFKGLSKKIPEDAKNVTLVFIGIGLFPLFFSGSYVNSSNFYIMMAVCSTLSYSLRRNIAKTGVFRHGWGITANNKTVD